MTDRSSMTLWDGDVLLNQTTNASASRKSSFACRAGFVCALCDYESDDRLAPSSTHHNRGLPGCSVAVWYPWCSKNTRSLQQSDARKTDTWYEVRQRDAQSYVYKGTILRLSVCVHKRQEVCIDKPRPDDRAAPSSKAWTE
jgi:hypothetical protein